MSETLSEYTRSEYTRSEYTCSEWDENELDENGWDDDEWQRKTQPLYDVMYSNDQGEFFEIYDINDVVESDGLLSALYISYCNQNNLKQKTKVFKARNKIFFL